MSKKAAWQEDQLLRSKVFHSKLHEWGLLDLAYEIDSLKGEELEWDKQALGIAENAWNKVIHRGIKPVRVFVHPTVIQQNPRRVSYYRMVAMLSQKSMSNVGLSTASYESGAKVLEPQNASSLATQFNSVISQVVDEDKVIDEREIDLWRGMEAGSQAQGTWNNVKGTKAENEVKRLIEDHLRVTGQVQSVLKDKKKKTREVKLKDDRVIVFASDPDIGIFRDESIVCGVEVKGGIDPAGVLERLGATLKSLARIKRDNPSAKTYLVIPRVAMTTTFKSDMEKSKATVDEYLAIEEVIASPKVREAFFQKLSILS